MKRIFTLLILLSSTLFYAQSSGITYQAIIYNPATEILPGNNNANAVLANKDVCLRFSIIDDSSNIEYQETQRVKTDDFGMVNLLIGEGDQIGGYASNFAAIVWDRTRKKLQVDIDITSSCANFIEISKQDFSIVPYAYASKVAETVSGIVPISNGGTGSNTVAGAKTNLGLNNVDNTSDINKPISTATQTALNDKAPLASPSLTGTPLSPTAPPGTNTNQIATTAFVTTAIATTTIPDATTTAKGKIKLTGDLGGTAEAPTVPGLANKENTITIGTTSQYWRGDKTWQTLNKSVVDLGNVDNTSDANKPISSATQIALNGKEESSNKSNSITLGTSDVLYPTQNAVKTYVDNQVSSGVADATTTVKGKLQLAGDLAGTGSSASSPVISNSAISTNKIADGAVTPVKLQSGSNDSVLVTDNVGNVTWLDRGAFGAVADMSTIEGAGTTANPFKVKDLGISTAKLANNSVTTAKLADDAVTNAKIGEIVSIENGGTGSDMNTTAGYIKQATTGANFSTVSSIPVTDVTGAVRSVNGVFPSNNGNVSVLIGQVNTGTNSDPTQVVTSPHNSDIYVISGQTGTPNDNGRTFINDGTNWHEIATNVAALENTFVKLSGSTMTGNLVFPSGNNITIADAPIGITDVANKGYVDTKIKGSGTINFIPKYSGTTNPTNTLTNSSIFDDGTNVGIGTSTPANKLEISHGTAGNSGLRFTNLNATSTATTTSNKVLGLNNNGDVVLTNVPGTQNIVDFSVNANPNTAGTTFVPNTPSDQSIVYQSTIDNSLWTYNGTSYITYTAPASTAWNLMSTTNDAGSNKTSNIWRSGGIIIGGSSTSKGYGNLTAIGGSNFTGVPGFGTASVGLINNSTAGWSGSGFLFSNSTAGSNAFSMVYNNDKAYFGQLTPANGVVSLGNWGTTGLSIGSGTDAKNKLDVFGGTTIGSYAGVNTAPTNGLIVSGNVGIGATTPATKLQVNSSTATNTINTEGIFTMQRPQNPGVKWENIAQFSLGSYSTSSNASSRLDLSLNDGAGITTSNVMTWLGNGYVGVGTTAPVSSFSNTSNAIQGSNSTNAFSGGLTWSTPGTGFAASFYSQPSNGNGLQIKIAGNTSANNALEVSSGATQTGSLTPLFNVLGNGNVGIGTTSPITKLIVNDNAYISSIPLSSTNLMDNSTYRPHTRFQNTVGINNNGLSLYSTTGAWAIQSHNYSTGISLPLIIQPGGGNVSIGSQTSPSFKLSVLGNSRIQPNTGNDGTGEPVWYELYGRAQSSSGLVGGIKFGWYTNFASIETIRGLSVNGAGLAFSYADNLGVTNEGFRLTNNGNFGIGTTTPTAQLHTTGSVLFAGAGTPGAGKVLTSDASGNATWQNVVGSTSVSTKTANFILTSADNAGFIVVNSASLITVTVPSTLPAGFYCQIIQQGAGQVQVVGSGVTMNSALGFFSRAQGSSIGIMMATSTTGFVSGDTGL